MIFCKIIIELGLIYQTDLKADTDPEISGQLDATPVHSHSELFNSFDIVPEVYLYSEFVSAIIAIVRKSLGIAVLPDSYAYHESPGLRFIKLPIQTYLYLNWRAQDHNPIISNVLKLIF